MKKGRRVYINDGNVEKALRKLKKKLTDSGLLQEISDRGHYVKPTIKRKLAKSAAKQKWNKHLKSQSLPKKLF